MLGMRSDMNSSPTPQYFLRSSVVETRSFRQDFPYVGAVESAVTSLGAQILSRTTSSYQFGNVGGAAIVSTPRSLAGPYTVLMLQSFSQNYDLDGSAMPTVMTSYQYDAFGNATQVVASTPDGFSKTTAIPTAATPRCGCWAA